MPLPGSCPYLNTRPIRIPARLDRRRLLDCVCEMYPHVSRETWCGWFSQGHIRRDGSPSNPMSTVRGGEQYEHLFPNTVEPDVNAEVTILAETSSHIVVDKPAPLPIHPSGRFFRNTLIAFLRLVYPGERLKLVHRLDANTSGLVLVARTSDAARTLARQFETGTVEKRYLARCLGSPSWTEKVCDVPISIARGEGGTRTTDQLNGKPACTRFRVIERFPDGTTLLQATPITGRTNQIRIHLWSLGVPIAGDPSYLPAGRIAALQTLGVNDGPMCLHAASLAFSDPNSAARVQWTSPAPSWTKWDQDAFSFSASASNLAISSSNCFSSDKSSA